MSWACLDACVTVERSPAFDAPWLVFGPVDGRVLLLACFFEWSEAIHYAHDYAHRMTTKETTNDQHR